MEPFVNVVSLEGSRGSADSLRQLAPQISHSCIVITGNPNLSLNLYDVADMYRRNDCLCLMVLEQIKNRQVDKNKVGFPYRLHMPGKPDLCDF